MNLIKDFNELNKSHSVQENAKKVKEKVLKFDEVTQAFIISKEEWEEWE